MKRIAVALLLALAGGTFQRSGAAQKTAAVSGKWKVTIRMLDRSVTEEWTIQQKGNAITGAAKGERGEMPIAGAIEGAFFRVTVKDGDKAYKVRATVDGNEMDGSINLGVGKQHLWFAKRSEAR